MIEYLRLEWRLSTRGGTWLLLFLFGVFRATGVISPGASWYAFLSVVYPLMIALVAVHLLDQERRWKTKPILRTSPKSTQAVLSVRFGFLVAPLVAIPFIITSPTESLSLIAPAALLSSLALALGGAFQVEWVAGVVLGWWVVSFLLFVTGAVLDSAIAQWLSIVAAPRTLPGASNQVLSLVKLGLAVLLPMLQVVRASGRIPPIHRDRRSARIASKTRTPTDRDHAFPLPHAGYCHYS